MFSITIPTCNRPHLLRRALASVAAQSVSDYRVVVVEDGDGRGAAVARETGDQRILVLSSGGAGQVRARNLALGACRDGWIAWLDDDDHWEDRDHLARIAALARAGEVLAHASGRVVFESEAGVSSGTVPFASHADESSLVTDNTLLASGIAYPAVFHARHGPFDETLPIYWDWDWFLRLARAGVPIVASGGQGVCYSVREGNVSGAGAEALRREDLGRFAAKHHLAGLHLKNHGDIAREQARSDDRVPLGGPAPAPK